MNPSNLVKIEAIEEARRWGIYLFICVIGQYTSLLLSHLYIALAFIFLEIVCLFFHLINKLYSDAI